MSDTIKTLETDILVIGAGPAGLMAAETLAVAGQSVLVADAMPNPARKFLMAGRGGLNLTHSEALFDFIARYGEARGWLAPTIRQFDPQDLIEWCHALGEETFVGSSGRVFPKSFKASPLLRAWLKRLNEKGVAFALRHRFTDFDADGQAQFTTAEGPVSVKAKAIVLALGGAGRNWAAAAIGLRRCKPTASLSVRFCRPIWVSWSIGPTISCRALQASRSSV